MKLNINQNLIKFFTEKTDYCINLASINDLIYTTSSPTGSNKAVKVFNFNCLDANNNTPLVYYLKHHLCDLNRTTNINKKIFRRILSNKDFFYLIKNSDLTIKNDWMEDSAYLFFGVDRPFFRILKLENKIFNYIIKNYDLKIIGKHNEGIGFKVFYSQKNKLFWLKKLVKHGYDINLKNDTGNIILGLACILHENNKTLIELLKLGSNIIQLKPKVESFFIDKELFLFLQKEKTKLDYQLLNKKIISVNKSSINHLRQFKNLHI